MRTRRVLIVDDEIFIVKALAMKFTNSNFTVATARNGREALDRIREEKPDLVITDFQMPVMNGLEFVRVLRSGEETRSIPIVMLTARGQGIGDEGAEPPGIDAFMSKPFSPREMVARAAALIGGR